MTMKQDHSKPYEILGIGEACVDLVLHVTDDFLKQFVPGEKGGAESITRPELDRIIQKTHQSPHRKMGGSCANAIKGLARLGMPCAFASTVGEDSEGNDFVRHLEQMGIYSLFNRRQGQTGHVLCLVTPDGQRTMRFCLENRQEVIEKHLTLVDWQSLKWIHLESYLFAHGSLMEIIFDAARKAQIPISLDLSSFEIVRRYRLRIQALLDHVQILFANEDEIRALAEGNSSSSPLNLKRQDAVVVILMGAQGCLVADQQHYFQSPAYPPRQLVDTTGAGDLFASGFLYGYLKGNPLETCAQLGNRLGSAVIEVEGAELPESSWEWLYETTPNLS